MTSRREFFASMLGVAAMPSVKKSEPEAKTTVVVINTRELVKEVIRDLPRELMLIGLLK